MVSTVFVESEETGTCVDTPPFGFFPHGHNMVWTRYHLGFRNKHCLNPVVCRRHDSTLLLERWWGRIRGRPMNMGVLRLAAECAANRARAGLRPQVFDTHVCTLMHCFKHNRQDIACIRAPPRTTYRTYRKSRISWLTKWCGPRCKYIASELSHVYVCKEAAEVSRQIYIYEH